MFWNDVIVNFFDVFLFRLSSLVTIITGSGIRTIFFYKGIDQKSGNLEYLEIGASNGYQILHECL